ncbi:MAG TPA: hypothetical protein ENN67_08340 [Firmicutes bacterium]|nr:hypothetical protein [Bacillota bacterium]
MIKVMNSITDDQSENRAHPETKEPVEVKSWPELSIAKWRQWGFDVSEVLRTPKYNFLVQPVKSSMNQTGNPPCCFILEGNWYSVDSDIERRMSAMIFPAAMMLMLFAIMLLMSVQKHQNIVAAFIFILMYAIVEGFVPLGLFLYARGKRLEIVEIRWNSINKIIFLPAQEILMIGWSDETNRAVALQVHPGMGERIIERLKDEDLPEAKISVIEQRTINNPP